MSNVIVPHYPISRNDVTPVIWGTLRHPLALALLCAMRHAGPVNTALQALPHDLGAPARHRLRAGPCLVPQGVQLLMNARPAHLLILGTILLTILPGRAAQLYVSIDGSDLRSEEHT